jgi:putative transposase
VDREVIRRRQLPHWDIPGAPYFITTCLEGSIPARGLLEIVRYREEQISRPKSDEAGKQLAWKKLFVQRERWLDDEPACRWLESPELACIVVDALFHFAGERYELFAFVVMPSHLHWVIRPLPACSERLPTARSDGRVLTPREQIVHSVNLFTATACNRLLNRRGRFWQAESYDHWVRDPDELDRIIAYIENNPVKAHLAAVAAEWPFSSAAYRLIHPTPLGFPLRH